MLGCDQKESKWQLSGQMATRSGTRIAVLFLLVTMLTSCSEDRPPGDSRPETAPSAPPESDFISGGDCPSSRVPGLPERTGCVSVAARDDLKLFVYASLNQASRPRNWHVRLIAPDKKIEHRLETDLDYPRAAGASDVDGDGRFEWWIRMGNYASHGAPWGYMNLFFPEGGKLVPLTFEGRPLPINYGGISRLGEGAECRDGNLVLLRAEAQDVRNTRWKISERILSIDGHQATSVGREQHRVVVENYVDPRIRRYFRVECHGDVFLPF